MSLDLLSTDEALRLECIRLAVASGLHDHVLIAGRLFDFVKGTDRASAVQAAKDAVDALR